MKFIVLLFGAAGFTLVMLSGWSAGRPPDLVLRDAALACLGTAFVGRWFGRVVGSAFAETLSARRAALPAAGKNKPAPAADVPVPAITRPR